MHSLLSQDEQVLLIARRHWTALLGAIWRVFLLFVFLVAVAVAANLILKETLATLPDRQQLALRVGIFALLLVLPSIVMLTRYLRWRAEQYVVTNLRVMQVSGLLSKRVLDSSLDKVNDVMLEQSIFGRLLDYGNLEILTASELGVNKFPRLARPLAFKSAMLNAKQVLEGTATIDRQDPTKLIAGLAQLRAQGVLTEEEFQAKKAKLLGEL